MTSWISFDALKRRVSLEDVLRHYGILDNLRRREDELVGICPLHGDTRASFSANTAKNAWQCFGCKKHGNFFDLVVAMEAREGRGISVRDAAQLLASWFQISSQRPQNGPERPDEARGATSDRSEVQRAQNTPLSFSLANLDSAHPYLKERGLTVKGVLKIRALPRIW